MPSFRNRVILYWLEIIVFCSVPTSNDVIIICFFFKQSYVQALQKKAQCGNWSGSGGGECSTLQSDSTHLTVLAGSEHAPPTDSDDELNQIRAAH